MHQEPRGRACSRFVTGVISGDPAGHPTVQTLVSPNTPTWVKIEACWRMARDTPSLVCPHPTHPARLQCSAGKGQVGPHLGPQVAWICPLVHQHPHPHSSAGAVPGRQASHSESRTEPAGAGEAPSACHRAHLSPASSPSSGPRASPGPASRLCHAEVSHACFWRLRN